MGWTCWVGREGEDEPGASPLIKFAMDAMHRPGTCGMDLSDRLGVIDEPKALIAIFGISPV